MGKFSASEKAEAVAFVGRQSRAQLAKEEGVGPAWLRRRVAILGEIEAEYRERVLAEDGDVFSAASEANIASGSGE